jgi:Tfp pilus assembly protein FimV
VERVLEQSVDRDIHPAATLLLSRILDELGDTEGARSQARKILAKYPHSSVFSETRQLLTALNEKTGR